jgi:hypothetical protein
MEQRLIEQDPLIGGASPAPEPQTFKTRGGSTFQRRDSFKDQISESSELTFNFVIMANPRSGGGYAKKLIDLDLLSTPVQANNKAKCLVSIFDITN